MRGHVANRFSAGKDHAGVFLGNRNLQGTNGIGTIVNLIVFYNDAINEGAATVENDVYNQVIDIE
jgi:hypothetical protein